MEPNQYNRNEEKKILNKPRCAKGIRHGSMITKNAGSASMIFVTWNVSTEEKLTKEGKKDECLAWIKENCPENPDMKIYKEFHGMK